MSSLSVHARLDILATKMYGRNFFAFEKALRDVLKKVWCAQTANPFTSRDWVPEIPGAGQDDVTSYFLVKHVYGGHVAHAHLENSMSHFVIWAPNGEGTSTRDFCRDRFTQRVLSFPASFTADNFLVWVCEGKNESLDFRNRLTLFSDRFDDAIEDLMIEAQSNQPQL